MVLLLTIYVFVFFGLFIKKDSGFSDTFKTSAPRLAAHIERDLNVGHRFTDQDGKSIKWVQ